MSSPQLFLEDLSVQAMEALAGGRATFSSNKLWVDVPGSGPDLDGGPCFVTLPDGVEVQATANADDRTAGALAAGVNPALLGCLEEHGAG